METGLNVFLSQRIEDLALQLENELYGENSAPFTQRLIVVHGPAMRSWLLQRLAKRLGIAMGIEIVYLNQTFSHLQRLLYPFDESRPHFPSPLDLSLAIETEIRDILNKISDGRESADIWKPMLQYLKVATTGGFTKRSLKRLVGLSEQLARLFIEYGKFGGERLSEWELGKDLNWQAQLWRRIYSKYPHWNTPYHAFSQNQSYNGKIDLQIHLFSVSFLTTLEYRYLNQLSLHVPINHYLLSPCAMFWSDICSDRERIKLNLHAPEKQREPLDEFLRDRNPLLANYGRLGREMAKTLEESSAIINESYSLSTETICHESYTDLLNDEMLVREDNYPFSMLKGIQADMLLLRNPIDSPPIEIETPDDSIQIHIASSRLREVEILYNNLLEILNRHKNDPDPLAPSDILVMAPAIEVYAPFIKAVFKNPDNLIDYQVLDLDLSSQSLLIQGFEHLISLSQSRWDAVSVLQLFDYPAFRRKFQFSYEDVLIVRDWIKQGGFRWGGDNDHRQEILKEDHCATPLIDKSGSGTWEQGFRRLIYGLINDSDEEGAIAIDMSNGDLLGKWMKLIRSIRSDLKILSNGVMQTLDHWAAYLECLLEVYFSIDTSDSASVNEYNNLKELFQALRKAGKTFEKEKFSFITVKKQLEALLKRKNAGSRETHIQAVRFCSLLPMRAIPGKVIVLLGMEDGTFPRTDKDTSLNYLRGDPKADYQPSQTDYDRYLFLEALLSARQYLLISAQGECTEKQEQLLSLLVTELLAYLDGTYRINGQKPSSVCLKKHPFHSFDKKYFSPNSPFKNFSQDDFKSAKAFYQPEKKQSHAFVNSFAIHVPTKDTLPKNLDLKLLFDMAEHPIKAHMRQSHGIYLDTSEKRMVKTSDEFFLSNLELSILKKEGLRRPLSEVIEIAEKRGVLPPGAFKPLAISKLKEKVDVYKEGLQRLNVSVDDIFEIDFKTSCQHPEQINQNAWISPPINVPYNDSTIQLTGKLKDVSPQGILSFNKNKKSEAFQELPRILVSSLVEKGLPFVPNLLFVEDAKTHTPFFSDATPLLNTYLDYYFIAKKQISPLHPDWIEKLLDFDDPNDFHNFAQNNITNEFRAFSDEYLLWTLRNASILKEEEDFKSWKDLAQNLYGDLLNAWYSPKSKKKVPNE